MTNITFGDYTPPPPPNGQINIRIGVFFDGTQNNRSNTRAGGQEAGYIPTQQEKNKYNKFSNKLDDSYTNDLSNVARKEYHYSESKKNFVGKVYVEGIGTKNLEGDVDDKLNHKGVAYGAGNTGIKEKVAIGCENIQKKIVELKGNNNINVITLDVFGFSRGAAAARNFVYEVGRTKPKAGLLGLFLDQAKIEYSTIVIRFLGIYDTVSSFDPHAVETTINPDFTNDVEELHLNTLKAKKIIHFCASDEHRKNFMLTRARYAGGADFFLPGVHSDIGGCYTHNMSERKQIMDFDNVMGDGLSDDDYDNALKNDLNNLIQQGWVKRSETEAPNSWHETYINRKHISNRYSFVTLHLMGEKVNQYYQQTINMNNLKMQYKIPNGSEEKEFPLDLTKVKQRLSDYIEGKKPQMIYYTNQEIESFRKLLPLKKISVEKFNIIVDDHNCLMDLRNKYIHWNSMFGEIGYRPNFIFDKKNLTIKRFRKIAKNS